MNNKDSIVTVLNKDERFAIYWCYNRAMDYVEKHSPIDPAYGDRYDLDMIVNGVNISETIKNLLGRLVV